jgi:hypothetical protein
MVEKSRRNDLIYEVLRDPLVFRIKNSIIPYHIEDNVVIYLRNIAVIKSITLLCTFSTQQIQQSDKQSGILIELLESRKIVNHPVHNWYQTKLSTV